MQHKRHFLIYLSKESGAVARFPTVPPFVLQISTALHTQNDRINIIMLGPSLSVVTVRLFIHGCDILLWTRPH